MNRRPEFDSSEELPINGVGSAASSEERFGDLVVAMFEFSLSLASFLVFTKREYGSGHVNLVPDTDTGRDSEKELRNREEFFCCPSSFAGGNRMRKM